MNQPNEDRTIEELLLAYANGQRHFHDWDFEEDVSVQDIDLSDAKFTSCFLFLDFRGANLTNVQFIGCNMKTADFRNANLTNALIKNCLVESTMFKGANVTKFQFIENYCFGATTQPGDFEEIFKDAGE